VTLAVVVTVRVGLVGVVPVADIGLVTEADDDPRRVDAVAVGSRDVVVHVESVLDRRERVPVGAGSQ